MVAAKATMADAMSKKERMSDFLGLSLSMDQGAVLGAHFNFRMRPQADHLQVRSFERVTCTMLGRLPGGFDGIICANLLFLCVRKDFFAFRRELVARFGKAGDDPAATRRRAFAIFLVVAHAGTALLGGELL
jgi:hypothetical protein